MRSAAIASSFLRPNFAPWPINMLGTDNAAQTVDLGGRTLTTDNAHAVLPFGTLDTPPQGGAASGSAYVNFGWTLTPNPRGAPFLLTRELPAGPMRWSSGP